MQKCFASTRTMDFERGNTEEFTRKEALQTAQYGTGSHLQTSQYGTGSHYYNAGGANLTGFMGQLEAGVPTAGNNAAHVESGTTATISLPFLYSTLMPAASLDIERYYHKLREFFAFDYDASACCNPALAPDPDESVYHFRNFRAELRQPRFRQKYPELGPQQAARDLVGHLPRGSKVALLSRVVDGNVQRHVAAFEERGLRVRIITGNSGEQDFCFLLSAEKEIIGNGKSTYFFWAGLLGSAKTVRLHALNLVNPGGHQNYEHPEELKARWNFSNFATNSTLDTDWH